jgi:hypothetical protein
VSKGDTGRSKGIQEVSREIQGDPRKVQEDTGDPREIQDI